MVQKTDKRGGTIINSPAAQAAAAAAEAAPPAKKAKVNLRKHAICCGAFAVVHLLWLNSCVALTFVIFTTFTSSQRASFWQQVVLAPPPAALSSHARPLNAHQGLLGRV